MGITKGLCITHVRQHSIFIILKHFPCLLWCNFNKSCHFLFSKLSGLYARHYKNIYLHMLIADAEKRQCNELPHHDFIQREIKINSQKGMQN